MFKVEENKLEKLGAGITVREVFQQPELWKEVLEIYEQNLSKIENFLDSVCENKDRVKVIFTGAGTSAYVGDIIERQLKKMDNRCLDFEAIATTDLVSNPYDFFKEDEATVLVSFARSGNSPESLKAVELANQIVKDINHLAITCAEEGKLSVDLKDKDNALVILMPKRSNDQGFAMTGSFTCMLLMSELIFDNSLTLEEKKARVEEISKLGNEVIEKEDEIQEILNQDFNRVVYLGSGTLAAFTREAQLKILELTAGEIATCFDSSMGFRHGPKSFVDENTLVFDFISNNEYTRLYDLDILNEVYGNGIARDVIGISQGEVQGEFKNFKLSKEMDLEDIFLVFPYAIFAQTVSVMASLKVNNTPDTPSKTGTVNRVVKGVVIHPYPDK
ncbi:MAG: SIS domain-containing protein [Lagierella massiliensis]|nr:SIS domain-containing protein [Lagierella massiliensis]